MAANTIDVIYELGTAAREEPEHGGTRRATIRHSPPTAHAPATVLPDRFRPCFFDLFPDAGAERIQGAVTEIAYPDLMAVPSDTDQTAFVDCPSAINMNELHPVFGHNFSDHGNTSLQWVDSSRELEGIVI
jgi:hypothetical protein